MLCVITLLIYTLISSQDAKALKNIGDSAPVVSRDKVNPLSWFSNY
jgi:hypothetical protein